VIPAIGASQGPPSTDVGYGPKPAALPIELGPDWSVMLTHLPHRNGIE
jgi:hypothetical protein